MSECVPRQRILGTSKVGSSSFQITFRMASSTQKLVLRCRDSSDQDSWICALSQPVLTIFPLELPIRLAPQTYHSLAANLVTLQVDRSVRRAYGSVFEAMRAVRGSTSMAALSIVLFGRLRTAVKIQQLEALHCWASAVSVGLQLEALEKAEALADLNKEFLDKADLVPLHMGMKNVGSLLAKSDFKDKFFALYQMRQSA